MERRLLFRDLSKNLILINISMTKNSAIRKIYLYLFSLLGLTLFVIGAVMIIDLGLKMTIFKKADMEYSSRAPIVSMVPGQKTSADDFVAAVEKCEEKCELADEQKELMASWLVDYKNWQEEQNQVSYTTQRRHRQASQALSLILIGLPLYLFHWAIIRKEIKSV